MNGTVKIIEIAYIDDSFRMSGNASGGSSSSKKKFRLACGDDSGVFYPLMHFTQSVPFNRLVTGNHLRGLTHISIYMLTN